MVWVVVSVVVNVEVAVVVVVAVVVLDVVGEVVPVVEVVSVVVGVVSGHPPSARVLCSPKVPMQPVKSSTSAPDWSLAAGPPSPSWNWQLSFGGHPTTGPSSEISEANFPSRKNASFSRDSEYLSTCRSPKRDVFVKANLGSSERRGGGGCTGRETYKLLRANRTKRRRKRQGKKWGR